MRHSLVGASSQEWLVRAYRDPLQAFPPMISTPGYTLPDLAALSWHKATAGLSVQGFRVHSPESSRNNWVLAPTDASARGNIAIVFVGAASDNILVLGKNTDLHGQVFFHADGGLAIFGEDMGQRSEVTARLWSKDNLLFWGRESTSNSVTIIIEGERNQFVLGDDCMMAREVDVRTSDEHAIFDLKTGALLNPPSAVHVEPHVWLGDKSTLLKGVQIGFGSVVGEGSIVTRAIPRFSIAAGVPAKVIRSEVSWSRHRLPEHGLMDRLRREEAMLVGAAP
jgi:acetyltransferase-like isoleucine patch superfamily enzyme